MYDEVTEKCQKRCKTLGKLLSNLAFQFTWECNSENATITTQRIDLFSWVYLEYIILNSKR